ncbi:hypothetical protein N7539_005272 [Penicillium diatomitis]|uniref:Uncharacterized protein n=1 Tax=Penicillium diatomitis TaxID=2819901 RepID=A0A9W9X6Z2_9EURO|nr:uncharacterized protein N7539_005272 [Penicillium diatomitis]KAJ5485284.1 hypothetical protein N7539_005272 [Penicillium diatomitis]
MSAEETTVPDQIIPFHLWDDVPYARSVCLNVTLRFDEVLDHLKLERALTELFQRSEWRKLGSRVRENASGRLEYHLPVQFSSDRPGFGFSTAQHDMPILSHPQASRMPSKPQTHGIHVLGRMSSFTSITKHPNAPCVLQDYLSADVPQLFIHVLKFTDTTLITVTFPHTLFDAMSLSYFLKAWTSILSGRKDQVPPFLGFNEDVFAAASEPVPAEQHVLYNQTCGNLKLGVFAFCREWEAYWYPQVEDRAVVIPHAYIERLRAKALKELRIQTPKGLGPDSNPSNEVFISEGDIILAWLCKALGIAMDAYPSTQVCIANVFDARSILGISQRGAYIGNGTIPCVTILRAQNLQEDPVSSLALRVRQSLLEQRDKSQVYAMDAMRRKAKKETGFLPVVGDPRHIPMMGTNWYRARLFDLDFSAARVRVDDGLRSEKPCKPVYINNAGPDPLTARSIRNFFTVIGKDGDGNWWFQILARATAWKKIEEVLHELAVEV